MAVARRLDQEPARVFRLLPLNPGPDISAEAAAVLAALPPEETRAVLARLVRAHLIEAVPAMIGRWRMHDLVRLYAQRLSDADPDPDTREQARDRLLSHYLATADAAAQHIRALPGTNVPEEFSSRTDALAWLDAERPALVVAVTTAARTGRDQIAMRLPIALARYFAWRRRFDDQLAAAAVSRDAAQRLGDRDIEAAALETLGLALRELRRFDEAIAAHKNAATIFRETGDHHREGTALVNLESARKAQKE